MDKKAETVRAEEAATRRVIGLFLMFFGGILVVAVYFTPLAIGKTLNTVSAVLLLAIGYFFYRSGRRSRTNAKEAPPAS